jgi:UDP-GlcNAc:undecaprenyl-phosphate GlcNAc-1-phosphate transferase
MHINLILIFFTSFLFSILLFPALINISKEKKIFDSPNLNRKIHQFPVPNIGGVGLFFSILFCVLIFSNETCDGANIFLSSFVLLFLFGLKDDLVTLPFFNRFQAQLIAGLLLILIGDFRVKDFSFIGFSVVSYPISVALSMIFFIFLTNAYNLIDGINGLLGSLTFFSSAFFFLIFILSTDKPSFSLILCLSMLASILVFLFFNFGEAKVFMGSSGSYIIGLFMYFNSIIFLNLNSISNLNVPKHAFLFSILAIPIYDTLRVFFLRLLERKSPFEADANHVHHRLLKLNFSHKKSVLILLTVNFILLAINYSINIKSDLAIIFLNLLLLIILNLILEIFIKKINKPISD